MIVHDIRTRGRPHPVVVFGLLFAIIVGAGIQISRIGNQLVQARLAG